MCIAESEPDANESEPEVIALPTEESKPLEFEIDTEKGNETSLPVDKSKKQSESKKKDSQKSIFPMKSDKKSNDGKDCKDKIDETVTDSSGIVSHSKDDSDRQKIETETKLETKDIHETKDKMKFDPEIFTMEIDGESQIDNKQETVEDVKANTEKESKKMKGKSKEFKAPASKKSKKVKGAPNENLQSKLEQKWDEEKDKKIQDSQSKDAERNEMEDMESSVINDDKNKSENVEDCEQLDEKDNEQNQYDKKSHKNKQCEENMKINLDKKSTETSKNDCNDKEMDLSGDEFDLATDISEINQHEAQGNKQAQAKINAEESDDDFDLVEKSMYDNDPVLDKPREIQHIDVTVYHAQDSDSDPFDMMLEE